MGTDGQIYLGLDLGSTASKGLLLGDGGVLAKTVRDTTPDVRGLAGELSAWLYEAAEIDESDVAGAVVTGYGRRLAADMGLPLTEITCPARGVTESSPDVTGVVDVGGQDAKAIRLGPDGPEDFALNDRCAAGTGRFLEVMAVRLGFTPEGLVEAALAAKRRPAISSTCTVFAESEVVGLVAEGVSPAELAAGLHLAAARRIADLAEQVGLSGTVALTGGVALNRAFVAFFREVSGLDAFVSPEPQFAGALGAALVARERG
ncbi:MAG: 2-hydroxyglutaryl-CoA dehydratase [Candidatus Coatesbacteria bacterium]|nr:MAG: 2-hydroxyglutaryl-CoA dehydratase [Candidatus Coatesbacteria bacterium]